MTSFQSQQLVKFGHDKVCLDGTHGTNSYDFQLYTLMTVDEFGSGCPVAFCFSNRADETIFKLFFEKIEIKVGVITSNVFMSDDAPAFYNAWSTVMTEVPNQLICTWHVDRNWRKNLSKIRGGAEKRAFVYKSLRVLLQCVSVDGFNNSLIQVLHDLQRDSDTVSFGEYFSSHYANRAQCWAYCYRLGLGINTNMYLESLHKVLKYVYLEGRKIKRLDKTVNAVLKIARDSLFKRLIKLAKNTSTDKVKGIKQSHKAGQAITSDFIRCLENESQFLVTSSSCASQQYHVVKVDEDCDGPCLRCTECDICVHTFRCTCIDYIIKLNICKHIHACVARARNYNSNLDQVNNCKRVTPLQISNIDALFSSNVLHELKPSQNDTIKERAKLVLDLCDSASLTNDEHQVVLKHFDKIIDMLNKRKTINLKTTEEINTNRKVEHQARLYSTKK
jgi:hypothetical protein